MKWIDALVRLQKYLAECGIASRRASEQLITQGRVRVNGSQAKLGMTIDPGRDSVEVDGEPVQPDRKVYVLLNKPRGVITSAKDTHDRPTVLDCLNGINARLFPVGRLDKETEGALLLTNDGELAYQLLHPKFGIPKVYLAGVRGRVEDDTVQHLRDGVDLEDGRTAPAEVAIEKYLETETLLRITIHEGKKREVRRMCKAVGHPVRSLQRLAFANLRTEGLAPGGWRHLDESELQELRDVAGA